MAHPYSSTPLYGATPAYSAQQSYYSPFPPNGLQQQIQTPPGISHQPPQPPPSYQPSPTTNGPRYDANTQIRAPAPPFPPFPPTTFGSDFFKQFASAGLPLPPPPSFPPVPIPTTGYPQLPNSVNASPSSPFPQHHSSGPQAFGSGFNAGEQTRQHIPDPFVGSQPGIGGTRERESQRDSHSYGAPIGIHSGNPHNARPVSRSVDLDNDKSLPSFGSRSDIDLLFATAQKQQTLQQSLDYTMGNEPGKSANTTNNQNTLGDGNVSPYDPTRPAAIHDRPSSGFGVPSKNSQSSDPKPMERTYDNKSLTELRQLAKGALLSLVPHKILYPELLKEGVCPQVLQELYGELGLKTEDPSQGQRAVPHDTGSSMPAQQSSLGTQEYQATAPSTETVSQSLSHPVSSAGPGPSALTPQPEAVPSPAVLDVRKQQSAPSPSLERKDRIAQLLAAKTGRQTSSPTAASSTQQHEQPILVPATRSVGMTDSQDSSVPRSPHEVQQEPVAASQPAPLFSKGKTQTDVLKQKMEQLKRETQVRNEARAFQSTQSDLAMSNDKSTVRNYGDQPPITSMIPGLFMSTAEPSGSDEVPEYGPEASKDDTEMTGVLDAVHVGRPSLPLSKVTSSPPPVLPAKRPSDSDTIAAEQPARTKLRPAPSTTHAGDEDIYRSEGEIIEEPESDAVAMGSESESQEHQEDYEQPSGFPRLGTSVAKKPESQTQPLLGPSQNSTANDSGSGELYRAKQTEIEAMRRKIAELEQRNKLKRSRSQMETPVSSNPPTPPVMGEDHQMSSSPVLQPSSQNGPNSSSNQLQRQPQGPRPISKLTPAQLAARAANLKADLLRQRAQRQQVLQEGLPDLNAEVKKTEARLENARSELARVRVEAENYRAGLERSVKLENELMEEVAHLEKQLQEGHAGQKQFSDELQQINLEKLAEAQGTPTQEVSDSLSHPRPLTNAATTQSLPGSSHVGDSDNRDATPLNPFSQPLSQSISAESVASVQPTATEEVGDLNGENVENKSPNFVTLQGSSHKETESVDPYDAPGDQVHAAEMEISPEPEEFSTIHQIEPEVLGTSQPSNDSVDMDGESNGSASMSDSGSDEEDYEPADAGIDQPTQQSDDEEYDPEKGPMESVTPTTGLGGEEDFYEPSENIDAVEPVAAPGGADASNPNGAMPSPGEVATPVDDIQAVSEVPINTNDDLESAPQLTEADPMVKTQPVQPSDETGTQAFLDGNSPPSPHYVPYRTPLSAFKTYRFHSDFHDTVKTGYRSLTYSNNIDPSRPLCPTELSGEACNDPRCEEQHFSQLGLPDDKILVQMSSASDIKDKAVRDQFLVGLKQVIADMRVKEVKEFESVADALSVYRRNFFAEQEQKKENQETGEEKHDP